MEGIQHPVSVANGVFEKASDVFEGSPLLSLVSWLLCVQNKFTEVTIGFLGNSSRFKIHCNCQLTFESCRHALFYWALRRKDLQYQLNANGYDSSGFAIVQIIYN